MNKIMYFFLLVILLVFPSAVASQGLDRYGGLVLRQGTNVRVRFPDNLDSDRNRNGDQFQAILDQNLVSKGSVLVRAGSIVFFRLVDVQAGEPYGDRSRVSITLTGIQAESSFIPIETNTLTVGTVPNRNQKLNFRIERSTTLDARGDRSEAMRQGGPGRERDWVAARGAADHGTFRWSGRVDGSDYIELRSDRVTVRHVQAQPIAEATYDARNPLPRHPVNVQLNKLRGRGNVMLVQQPSAANNFTAVVYIEDNKSGNDLYEFELSW
jgi:hypothetical protein